MASFNTAFSSARIARIILAVALFGFGFFAATQISHCRKSPDNITILEKDLKQRLDNTAKERDSLGTILDRWIGYYNDQKNAPPQYVYRKGETVIIRDTITHTNTLHDTIVQTDLVFLDSPSTATPPQNTLKLPYYFTLRDEHLRIVGHITDKGIFTDTLSIYNSIALQDKVKRTFGKEKHTIGIAQSNPYVSQMTYNFQYEKPTKRAIFVQKAASFAIGAVLGYGYGYLSK